MRFLVIAVVMGLAACGEPFLEYDTRVEYTPESDGVLQLTGPILTERVPASLEQSARNDAAVFVVDADAESFTYGQLVASTITYDAQAFTLRATIDGCSASARLALCVLDSVRDLNEERVGRTRAFDDAFELRDDDPSDGIFRSLRPALIRAGYELGSISGATLFSVPCAL